MNSLVVIHENGGIRLCLDDGKASLFYKGETYTFGCHPFEPMAIIYKDDAPVAYIHNAFDVNAECQAFMTNSEHLVNTVTRHYHNAEHFCRLLTVAIDRGYDGQIDELEKEMFEQVRWENHEVFYKTDDIEFGRYGDEPEDEIDPSEWDEEPDTGILEHSEYEILYVIIDGVKYVLRGDWISTLSLIIAGEKGKKAVKARIHQFNGIPESYPGYWRSGALFSLIGGGIKYNTEIFCQILAYAIRTGKKDYNLREIEKAIGLREV
ncbi:MAG: hypothetical protein IJQ83_05135 [Bacteroidales bacterium]|nr:hypothetical protein [Bacteroidales bacterium]